MVACEDELYLTERENGELLKDLVEHCRSITNTLDFSESSRATDKDYHQLLGVSRENFNFIFGFIKDKLHSSSNRSARNALAVFLSQLRLNLSQNILALLYGFKCQSAVSQTVTRVARLLDESFVPHFLGLQHMTRDECRAEHQSSFASTLCDLDAVDIALAMDGTYLYTESPTNHKDQRDCYSGQKKRSLCKPMMIVTPTGYIIGTISS